MKSSSDSRRNSNASLAQLRELVFSGVVAHRNGDIDDKEFTRLLALQALLAAGCNNHWVLLPAALTDSAKGQGGPLI